MNSIAKSPLGKILITATSSKSLSWQVITATTVMSILLHIFASYDLGYSALVYRFVISAISVLPLFALIWLTHKLPVKSQYQRVTLVLLSYVLGGALRGFTLSVLLDIAGLVDISRWLGRIGSSAISMGVTIAILTYVWSTFAKHTSALAELRTEAIQLKEALEQIEIEKEAEALQQIGTVSSQIVSELERIQLHPLSEQVTDIERVIDEVVRPLSREYAIGIKKWIPQPSENETSKVWQSLSKLDPVAYMPSPIFVLAVGLTPFPIAYSMYGLENALQVSLFSALALMPSLYIGFKIARKYVPKLKSPWREIFFTFLMELVAIPGSAATYLALVDTPQPETFIFSGLITLPIYAWVLSIGGALLEDLKSKKRELKDVKRNLNWVIARINLLSWYNRGIVSRLLHGPIQNSLHATLIRLKNSDPSSVIDQIIRELQERIRSVEPITEPDYEIVSNHKNAFEDIPRLWSGISEVAIFTTPNALRALDQDPPGSAIVIDLCNEVCSNAIRHGKANYIEIQIDAKPGVIKIAERDDGSKPPEGKGVGLGTEFLDNCSISWKTEQEDDGNKLKVSLPTTWRYNQTQARTTQQQPI